MRLDRFLLQISRSWSGSLPVIVALTLREQADENRKDQSEQYKDEWRAQSEEENGCHAEGGDRSQDAREVVGNPSTKRGLLADGHLSLAASRRARWERVVQGERNPGGGLQVRLSVRR
jgi:hypothetical protein